MTADVHLFIRPRWKRVCTSGNVRTEMLYLGQRLKVPFCYLRAAGQEESEHVHARHIEGVGYREKGEELVLLGLVVQHLCFWPTGGGWEGGRGEGGRG